MRPLAILTLVLGCTLCTLPALAEPALENPTRAERNDPSMLQYGFAGFGSGLLIGTAGGYIAARDPNWDWDKRDYRALGLGAGIGALSGMALGLGLGAADLGAKAPGYGGIVLRDTLYGTGLGALAGAIGGTISAVVQSEGEHVLFGTAIGMLAGAGTGMIIGFIEAPRAVRQRRKEEKQRETKPEVRPNVSAARDMSNQMVLMLGGVGRF
jgi:hypothetical protein